MWAPQALAREETLLVTDQRFSCLNVVSPHLGVYIDVDSPMNVLMTELHHLDSDR